MSMQLGVFTKEHFGQSNSTFMEHTTAAPINRGLVKANTTHFTILDEGEQTQVEYANPIDGIRMNYRGHFELECGQSMVFPNYQYEKQCYEVFSTYGPQVAGRMMLPINIRSDEGPIFVNAKQYHGIIRRRESRAKAQLVHKRLTKRHKPYMHHSRHLHALRRPRGCGGRFLNTKTLNDNKETTLDKKNTIQIPQPAKSQVSEIVQSDVGNTNSPKEINSNRWLNNTRLSAAADGSCNLKI